MAIKNNTNTPTIQAVDWALWASILAEIAAVLGAILSIVSLIKWGYDNIFISDHATPNKLLNFTTPNQTVNIKVDETVNLTFHNTQSYPFIINNTDPDIVKTSPDNKLTGLKEGAAILTIQDGTNTTRQLKINVNVLQNETTEPPVDETTPSTTKDNNTVKYIAIGAGILILLSTFKAKL